jgi:hypothetical protein
MDERLKAVLDDTPMLPQRQDSTTAQLRDLADFARTLGMCQVTHLVPANKPVGGAG